MAAALDDAKFVLFTTFKQRGEPVATPVWIVTLSDGRLGFTTSSGTWKVKRLRRNPAARVQPCSRTGSPVEGTVAVASTAEVVTDGPHVDEVRRAIRAKYGVQVPVVHALQTVVGKVRRSGQATTFTNDAVILVTLDGPKP